MPRMTRRAAPRWQFLSALVLFIAFCSSVRGAEPGSPAEAAILEAGMVAWRKSDANGISCADCHTPFGYDIAQFSFNRTDVRLATTPHLTEPEADAIFEMLQVYRAKYVPVGGLKDFRTFRPLQPGGGLIVGGAESSADVRDAAFGFTLTERFKFAGPRITTLAQAREAAQELVETDVASIPIGIRFNLWSRSVLREGPEIGGEIAEWVPSTGLIAKPEFAAQWLALQDAYVADPSTENMWAIYQATGNMVDLDPHNFVANETSLDWKWIILSQHRANLVFSHDELLKARGLPSLLDAEDGVRPFREKRSTITANLSPFWTVGDLARVVQLRPFSQLPLRNRESMWLGTAPNMANAQTWGNQTRDLRLTWFWIGWMMDNSLRFSGEGSTLSGEYFIGSLWEGEAGENTQHGMRMHQMFFNAVHQYKLGFKEGAWRDNSSRPQRFDSRKDYFLGYGKWRPRNENDDIGLSGANALYKRLMSNHQRMNVLIHNDELRRIGIGHLTETEKGYLYSDLELWRGVLNWADPDWASPDLALLETFRSTIQGVVKSLPPFIELGGGNFDAERIATLVPMAASAAIRYTIDGSAPSATNGTLYEGPFALPAETLLRAVAIESGLPASEEVRATFGTAASALRLMPGITPAEETPTTNGTERGLRFKVLVPGVVTAVRYYRTANETGVHTARLWRSTGYNTGELLASTAFTPANDAAGAGWREQPLDAPYLLVPGETYVASVNANTHFAATPQGFRYPLKVGPLLASGGLNGVAGGKGYFPFVPDSESNYLRDVVFTPLSSREQWRQARFNTPAPTGDAADGADPNDNGVPNLLEYALDPDPVPSDEPAAPLAGQTPDGRLTLSFVRARADLDYVVEGSTDLMGEWSTVATNPGEVGETVTVTDNFPSAAGQRFLRLRVGIR